MSRRREDPARRVLGERLARGEISEQEHASRLAALAESGASAQRGSGLGRWVAAAAAAAALAAAGGLAVAAFAGAGPARFPNGAAGSGPAQGRAVACSPRSLTGQVVDVTLIDHGRMGNGGMMGGGPYGAAGGMMGGGPYGRGHGDMMRVLLSRGDVAAGTVSFDVRNAGALTHELVVLPLPAGQPAGARAVRVDGTVSEAGSLGEASATCRAGHGDGIAAGSSGWVTLRLSPGRYELVCDIPGHYARGMHAELDVH